MSVKPLSGYGELVLMAAGDRAALTAALARLEHFLDQAPEVALSDVAYTCAEQYRQAPEKNAVVAFVVASVEELRARLAAVRPRLEAGAERIRDKSGTYYFRTHLIGPGTEGKLAFLFPGAASFYPDMLRDLAIGFAECRAAFDELEEALSGIGTFSPSSFIFPPAPYYRHDADIFSGGAYAQAMVSTYSANAALNRMFQLLGVRPQGVAGFAGGDLNALAAAGYFGDFRRPDRLKFLREMYDLVDAAVTHAGLPKCVTAVLLSPHPECTRGALESFPPDKVATFFEVTPRQHLVAAAPEIFDRLQEVVGEMGAKVRRLDLDRPFNTPWCEKILPMCRKFAGHWTGANARLSVWCCATAAPLPEKGRKARDICAELWTRPILLGETIRKMYKDGFRVFLEVGPRDVATKAAGDVLRGQTHAALVSNAVHRSGLVQFQHAAGTLAALGAVLDPRIFFARRRCHLLDFDMSLTLEAFADAQAPLSREFPALSLLSADSPLAAPAAPSGRAGKARERAAAKDARERRQRQFDFGATLPLISDMEVVDEKPGVSVEIAIMLSFTEAPYLADAALGTSQISYADGELRGLALLPLATGAEIMAEIAQLLAPKRHVVAVDDLNRRRMVAFEDGRLKLFVRAERVSSEDPQRASVRVQIRDDSPDSAWTWPALEATVGLASAAPRPASAEVEALQRPRSVNWTVSDIYPDRLSAGERLRYIRRADLWNDVGLDYEVEVPPAAGAVAHTRFPVWIVHPQLVEAILDGYRLWRSHERFPGAFSFAFRIRRLALHVLSLPEGQRLKCYLRLTGVTAKSHICDILVTDGNGNLALELRGYEELTERVPNEYRELVLKPPLAFLTEELPAETLAAPERLPFASAAVMEVPYAIFTRNEEIWLKTVSQIVLGKNERATYALMPAVVNRRVEWLFGRIAAKEAVRRFMKRYYQARWADADIEIWADDSGKPHALGKWRDMLSGTFDLAIAHTAQFVVAVFAARSRVGVDVEAMDRDLSDDFTHGVFGEEEFALILGAANPQAAMIRFWCAKEAVSKALGTGIRYAPKDLVVAGYRPETGDMELVLKGAWDENFKAFKGRPVRVASTVVRGHVVASCFIAEKFFER